MFETQQTLDTDSTIVEGNENAMVETTTDSDSSSANVKGQAELALIERSTGRKFQTLEDAEKYLQNLNRMVGDGRIAEQRKKAELADAVVSQYANERGLSHEEAQKELEGIVAPSKKTNRAVTQQTQMVDPRIDALERELFLSKTPEAQPYIERIERYAKASNVSVKEAYQELYGDVLSEKAKILQSEAKRKEKQMASVSTSSSAPSAPSTSRSKELLSAVRQKGYDDSLFLEALKARSRETYSKQEE